MPQRQCRRTHRSTTAHDAAANTTTGRPRPQRSREAGHAGAAGGAPVASKVARALPDSLGTVAPPHHAEVTVRDSKRTAIIESILSTEERDLDRLADRLFKEYRRMCCREHPEHHHNTTYNARDALTLVANCLRASAGSSAAPRTLARQQLRRLARKDDSTIETTESLESIELAAALFCPPESAGMKGISEWKKYPVKLHAALENRPWTFFLLALLGDDRKGTTMNAARLPRSRAREGIVLSKNLFQARMHFYITASFFIASEIYDWCTGIVSGPRHPASTLASLNQVWDFVERSLGTAMADCSWCLPRGDTMAESTQHKGPSTEEREASAPRHVCIGCGRSYHSKCGSFQQLLLVMHPLNRISGPPAELQLPTGFYNFRSPDGTPSGPHQSGLRPASAPQVSIPHPQFRPALRFCRACREHSATARLHRDSQYYLWYGAFNDTTRRTFWTRNMRNRWYSRFEQRVPTSCVWTTC